MNRLAEPLKKVLGPRSATPLARLGLVTTGDLLRHYPRRYARLGEMTDMGRLVVGEDVTVLARVEQAQIRTMKTRRGATLEVILTDGVRHMAVVFFAKGSGALRGHEARLVPGRVGMFSGTVGMYRQRMQLAHPAYQLFGQELDDEFAAMAEAGRPVPVYAATKGLHNWQITNAVRMVLDPLTADDVVDPVPEEIRRRRDLPTLFEAMRSVHRPWDDDEWRRAQHRLRYDEALTLQIALARRRAEAAANPAVARPGTTDPARSLLAGLDARLPFPLTDGQREVGALLAADLAAAHPMQRLLQGEVGSGKTVVALRAMAQVVDSGGQAALLAPTEVLAQQHAATLRDLLGPLADAGTLTGGDVGTRVALLTGSLPAAARREALADLASGAAGIVVGTHALLAEGVEFADLGLVVVDEQHRFGVEQRDALRSRGGTAVHQLVMTATPIPRTVAMTVFGDLEPVVLAEVPAQRAGQDTHLVPADNERWMQRTWQRVREEVDAGRRAFVVCARIEPEAARPDDETVLGLTVAEAEVARPPRAVLEVAEELRRSRALAGVPIGVLHGKMPGPDKERAMADLASGATPVLVTTTVIEVGVDVTEATVMVILDADRFGLAQLHQLRGRVGRGQHRGVCLLVSSAPPGTDAAVRLETLAGTDDGFRLAEVDLELRSEGDVLGAAQTGGSSLRLLRVVQDADLVRAARDDAEEIVAGDPGLVAHPALREAVERALEPEREEFLDRA